MLLLYKGTYPNTCYHRRVWGLTHVSMFIGVYGACVSKKENLSKPQVKIFI